VIAPMITPIAAPATPVLKAAAGMLGTVKWTASLGRVTKTVDDEDLIVQSLLMAINNALKMVAANVPEQRILVIIDGLDKIHEEERAAELFIQSNLIARLACCLIVACPFALRHHVSIGSSLGFSSVPSLMNEPVMDQVKPAEHGPGVAFFCQLFEHRVRDLDNPEKLITRVHLEKLAYYSGGRARDFVKLIRILSELAWDEDIGTATEAVVDETLDTLRREREMGIHRGHIDLLRGVMADSEHRLPKDPLTHELLRYSLLLPYSNGSEWFYPHPLLLMHMLVTRNDGSSASSASSR
ncbi:MAG TPA: hypothetical protein PK156_38915, partial [Polyangium sp.]|nr:hypothetical protein [Polyangium sp.]